MNKSVWTVLQMILSCFSIIWVSNVDVFDGKIRFTVTGGILMKVKEIVKNIIEGSRSCGITHNGVYSIGCSCIKYIEQHVGENS